MKALGNLSEDQQEIVLLRYIQGFSIKETMRITGKTNDSIKSLSKRALAQLKKLLDT